jgi:hypothetical protein
LKKNSLKTTFHIHLKAFTLCAGFFSLVACKEKSTIKPDLIPGVDNINTFEVNDLTLSVKNTYYDSLQTNVYTYPLVAIGGITEDAFFGRTMAGAYMQFIPPSADFTFPAGVQMDSAVISIPYMGFSYADTNRTNTNHALNLKAYEITDNFALGDASTKYYTFNRLAYNTIPVGSDIVTVKSLNDTVTLSSGDTVNRLLRMRVDVLKDRFKNMSATDLASAAAFLTSFKGIYLAPDTTKVQNTIAYFGMTAGNSSAVSNYDRAQLEFYYHTATDPKAIRAFFKFSPTYCSFFNGIYRNYTGSPSFNYFNSQTVNRDSLLIQTYPGFRSDLTIKIDNKIPPSVINKATITLTALKTGDDGRFNAPPQLIVTVVNDDGTERIISDLLNNDGSANASGQSFVGGAATTVKINGTDFVQYTLNIPREIQKTISEGKTELKLRLASSVTYPGSFRMVADGPNSSNSNTRLKLNVIYTKLK